MMGDKHMPPKNKFSKEEVLKTAFQLVREQGIENLNARNIAKMLHSSTQPIFSYYKNMAELKAELFEMVSKYNSSYFDDVELGKYFLSNICMAYIDFAIEEPNLFRLMFMSDNFSGTKLGDFFTNFADDCNKHLMDTMPKAFDMESPDSNRIFIDAWLYAHGISTMLVMNQLPTPRSEIETMMKNMCRLLTDGGEELS
jgi:AcrR family transcriptional regulator